MLNRSRHVRIAIVPALASAETNTGTSVLSFEFRKSTGGRRSKPWLCARRLAQELDHLGFLDAHPPRREVFSCYSGADMLIISEDHELRGVEGTRRGPHLHMHARITELPPRTQMEFSYLQQEVIRGFRFKFGDELRSLSLRP